MEHEQYAELIVLAAGGQLSGEEYDHLRAHVEVCACCRRELAEYQDMVFTQFPITGFERTGEAVGAQFAEAAHDYKNRFMARAKAEGIPLTIGEEASKKTFWAALGAKLAWSPLYAYAAVLVLSLFGGFVVYRLHEARTREFAQSREKQDLQDQISALRLRKARTVEVASTTDQVSRMKELAAQLGDANDSLDRAKKLLAADHDIRDLMGARTLHITDVYDVDSHGKTKSPFGRVFYTEGKSLIFYAFDLGKTKRASVSERSYQLWGYQDASGLSTQSLGMLYQDDQKQNRWVLKFNDPAVLSAIDAVFVTAEP